LAAIIGGFFAALHNVLQSACQQLIYLIFGVFCGLTAAVTHQTWA